MFEGTAMLSFGDYTFIGFYLGNAQVPVYTCISHVYFLSFAELGKYVYGCSIVIKSSEIFFESGYLTS
jgi:hypothetical protein